jgi:DNA processing protein
VTAAPASERTARAVLASVVDAGDPAVAELVDTLGAVETWQRLLAGERGRPLAERVRSCDHEHLSRMARHLGMRFIVPGDSEWPARLDDLRHCGPVQRRGGLPIGLWVRGRHDLAQVSQRSVAIVGSRAATAYGASVAADLAADLAAGGIAVVSGGAYGIDAAAHRGALAAGGCTIAVLACGADVAYPRGNEGLLDEIARTGLVVSELPPGENPTRVRFLARNRLIAAMSSGVVVVEAALRSGARNTASWSSECGRPVMAVPGPVYSAQSAAPHLMIRHGQATLVGSASEVRELIAPMGEALVSHRQGETRETDLLSELGLAVFEALATRSWRSVGEVAARAHVSVPECLAELTALEQSGLAEGCELGWRMGRPARR